MKNIQSILNHHKDELGFLKKLCKIHVKTSLLESFFNNVADFKAWNFNKKRLQHRLFLVNFPQFFKKPYLRTPLNDCPCWFLHSNQSFIHWSTFVCFFLHFISFTIDNCNYESLLRKCLKMKIFLLFTIVFYFLHKCF